MIRLTMMVTLLSLGVLSAPTRQNEVVSAYNPKDYSTGVTDDGCPPEGVRGDPYLNLLKNRDIPPKTYQAVPIADLIRFNLGPAEQMGAKHRQRWTVQSRLAVVKVESQAIMTEGYLIACEQQGAESCNCYDKTKVDYHLWLGSTEQTEKANSLIAEISPRTLKLHPTWNLKVLIRLAKQRSLVRLGGWVMWDSEHGSSVGKTRSTLLEIHPIHRIEISTGSRWLEL